MKNKCLPAIQRMPYSLFTYMILRLGLSPTLVTGISCRSYIPGGRSCLYPVRHNLILHKDEMMNGNIFNTDGSIINCTVIKSRFDSVSHAIPSIFNDQFGFVDKVVIRKERKEDE